VRPLRPRAGALATWAPLVAWMVLIYILSDQPDLPHASGAIADTVIKKGLHAAGYAVLAVLWRRALVAHRVPRAAAWAFVLTVAYAVTDEWHQTFVPGRTGRATDVAIDALGACAGLLVVGRRAARSNTAALRDVL
jgi:VanZ family protein